MKVDQIHRAQWQRTQDFMGNDGTITKAFHNVIVKVAFKQYPLLIYMPCYVHTFAVSILPLYPYRIRFPQINHQIHPRNGGTLHSAYMHTEISSNH